MDHAIEAAKLLGALHPLQRRTVLTFYRPARPTQPRLQKHGLISKLLAVENIKFDAKMQTIWRGC
jgi:hypothetical protein